MKRSNYQVFHSKKRRLFFEKEILEKILGFSTIKQTDQVNLGKVNHQFNLHLQFVVNQMDQFNKQEAGSY